MFTNYETASITEEAGLQTVPEMVWQTFSGGKMQIRDLLQLKGHVCSIDTETTGLLWYQHGLIGISVHCPELNISEYIFLCDYVEKPYGRLKKKHEWHGDYTVNERGRRVKLWVDSQEQPTRLEAVPNPGKVAEVKAVMAQVASDPKTTLIFHNAKFDCHFLELDLLDYPCKLMDTSVMVHLYDSRLKKSLAKAEAYFLSTNSKRNLVTQAPKKNKNMMYLWPEEVIYDYAKNDAVVTYQLAEVLTPMLRKLKLMDLFRAEMVYMRVVWQIERRGVEVNFDFCDYACKAFEHNLEMMQQDLFEATGQTFNWKSTMQLSNAIYDGLGIRRPENPFANEKGEDNSRHAHGGKYNKSATSSFLLMEKAKHPLGGLILDLREAYKLKGNVEKYVELSIGDGVAHTSFNLTGTRTGRLSSSKPNMQNVASEHRVRETQSVYTGGSIRKDAYNLRRAFKARDGHLFVSVDHKQQEMKLFSILAEEPTMLQALVDRKDLHLMIAISVWGDCGKELNKLHREWSKTISFGLIYGMTSGSLRYRLDKTAAEAEEITDQYWVRFPRIQPFIDEVIENVRRYGRVRYWSGRIWREDEELDFYIGVNAQIQGGAADLLKIAIMRIQHVLRFNGWGSVASIIHDEVLAEVKKEYVAVATPVLASIMELNDVFGLPFIADVKIGDTYGTLREIGNGPENYPLEFDVTKVNWLDYVSPDFVLADYTLTAWKSGKI